MTKAFQKVTIPTSRDIPFDGLMLNQSNVRRIKAGLSDEELAEAIARRGLLQTLSERDAGSAIPAEDDFLTEKMQRVTLHPLDQFRAFVAQRDKGQSDEEITAAFFVTPQIVKKRLKLASVASVLLDIYTEDGMTLEQLMAFTVNTDHARQAQIWDLSHSSWNKEPFQISRMLNETLVRVSDLRAGFVDVEAYKAAGGTMLHNRFQGDDGGWFEDPALLDRLVTYKLQAEAETVPVEGWKWIEVVLDLPYDDSHGLQSLSSDPAPVADHVDAAHVKPLAEYQSLEEKCAGQDEIPDKIVMRPVVLETEERKVETRPMIFDQTEIRRAGEFMMLNRYGALAFYRSYMRPSTISRTRKAELSITGRLAALRLHAVHITQWFVSRIQQSCRSPLLNTIGSRLSRCGNIPSECQLICHRYIDFPSVRINVRTSNQLLSM